MQPISEQRVLSMILERGGYARSKDLRAAGVHPGMLPSLERSGRLVRIKRGLYSLPDNEKGDDRLEALMAIPGSILCLGSALSIHEIGTWEPPEIYLAVQSGRKVQVPELLPIRLFHFAKASFELGLIEKAGQDSRLRVYDAERTICDLFRLKNRLGGDIAAEALREYMKHNERRIPRLLEYAAKLHVLGPLQRSLEILL
ncbi:MAG: type IV toxin-antitoxin system AbiEi family antitoxin domain-containing protein [Spirochaetaceae bacterium]|nr:type IV toxin-antitoxin system AbiEi family antitoxin domain-containing protein [Spirochaetaceae bacterium]